MSLDPEEVDLLALTRRLISELGSDSIPGSYLLGKTVIRDLLLSYFACSELEAEQLVDTLVAREFLRFRTSPETEGGWQLQGQAR